MNSARRRNLNTDGRDEFDELGPGPGLRAQRHRHARRRARRLPGPRPRPEPAQHRRHPRCKAIPSIPRSLPVPSPTEEGVKVESPQRSEENRP